MGPIESAMEAMLRKYSGELSSAVQRAGTFACDLRSIKNSDLSAFVQSSEEVGPWITRSYTSWIHENDFDQLKVDKTCIDALLNVSKKSKSHSAVTDLLKELSNLYAQQYAGKLFFRGMDEFFDGEHENSYSTIVGAFASLRKPQIELEFDNLFLVGEKFRMYGLTEMVEPLHAFLTSSREYRQMHPERTYSGEKGVALLEKNRRFVNQLWENYVDVAKATNGFSHLDVDYLAYAGRMIKKTRNLLNADPEEWTKNVLKHGNTLLSKGRNETVRTVLYAHPQLVKTFVKNSNDKSISWLFNEIESYPSLLEYFSKDSPQLIRFIGNSEDALELYGPLITHLFIDNPSLLGFAPITPKYAQWLKKNVFDTYPSLMLYLPLEGMVLSRDDVVSDHEILSAGDPFPSGYIPGGISTVINYILNNRKDHKGNIPSELLIKHETYQRIIEQAINILKETEQPYQPEDILSIGGPVRLSDWDPEVIQGITIREGITRYKFNEGFDIKDWDYLDWFVAGAPYQDVCLPINCGREEIQSEIPEVIVEETEAQALPLSSSRKPLVRRTSYVSYLVAAGLTAIIPVALFSWYLQFNQPTQTSSAESPDAIVEVYKGKVQTQEDLRNSATFPSVQKEVAEESLVNRVAVKPAPQGVYAKQPVDSVAVTPITQPETSRETVATVPRDTINTSLSAGSLDTPSADVHTEKYMSFYLDYNHYLVGKKFVSKDSAIIHLQNDDPVGVAMDLDHTNYLIEMRYTLSQLLIMVSAGKLSEDLCVDSNIEETRSRGIIRRFGIGLEIDEPWSSEVAYQFGVMREYLKHHNATIVGITTTEPTIEQRIRNGYFGPYSPIPKPEVKDSSVL